MKLDLGSGLSRVRTLKGLKELKGITAGNVEISGIKDMLGDPAQITELQLKGITSMEGIASFENLERLTVRDYPDTNLKQLVPLKRLNYLSLEDTVDSDSIISTDKDKIRVKDYSAISVMSGLKSLYLNSDIIKDIGFIKGLPALEDLTLEDTGRHQPGFPVRDAGSALPDSFGKQQGAGFRAGGNSPRTDVLKH
ncbi:MAG: hypothetical protein ACLTBV_01575 [Enterocloster bolteae]